LSIADSRPEEPVPSFRSPCGSSVGLLCLLQRLPRRTLRRVPRRARSRVAGRARRRAPEQDPPDVAASGARAACAGSLTYASGSWAHGARLQRRGVCYNGPRGPRMISLTEALFTLVVYVGPPLLIGAAAFAFLFRN